MALLGISSCYNDDKINSDPDKDEVLDIGLEEIVSDARYSIISSENRTVEEMAILLFGYSLEDEETNNARERFLKANEEKADSLQRILGTVSPMYTTWEYEYYSVDQAGNPIKLSAFMSAGSYWWFGMEYTDQDHIYLICPYTHTLEGECATKDDGGYEFASFLSTDNLFIMPDGQGFGSNAGNVQPYIDHNTQARQIYDALVAGYNIYCNDGGEMEDDWTLRVVGASQGGGDAIAVHKYLDTSEYCTARMPGGATYRFTLGDYWRFEYSYACSGPYSPVETLKNYFSSRELEFPCVIPMVIKSMLGCNAELAAKYKESDFYTDKYNGVKAKYDEIYRKKTLNTSDINESLAEDLNTDGDKEILSDKDCHVFINRILNQEVLNENSQIYKDFMACLEKQDLTSGWVPETRTYLYASYGDKTVPPVNTVKLAKLFQDCGVSVEVDWEMMDSGHTVTCTKFMALSW